MDKVGCRLKRTDRAARTNHLSEAGRLDKGERLENAGPNAINPRTVPAIRTASLYFSAQIMKLVIAREEIEAATA
jgi:hypothetical protein